MLVTFALLIVAVVLAPPIWFVWWLLADWAGSTRSRRSIVVQARPRAANVARIADDWYDQAA